MYRIMYLVIGLVTTALSITQVRMADLARRPRHDERGLSQSTENAILLAGAVSIALAVTTAVLAYVKAHLPK